MRTALQYLMLRPLAAVDDGPLGTDADGVATDISGGRRPHRAGAEEDDGGLERLDGWAGEAAGVTHGADAGRCGRCIQVKSSQVKTSQVVQVKSSQVDAARCGRCTQVKSSCCASQVPSCGGFYGCA